MARGRVAHLTSVHEVTDPRIFYKQCVTLARHGYDVVLVAPHEHDDMRCGVRIRAVRRARGRALRLLFTVFGVWKAAVAEDCEVYHLHDPELLLVGLFLKLRGKTVVYDVHEDYRTAIRQKSYLPRVLRGPLAVVMGWVDAIAARLFNLVLAERYYERRFPRGTVIANYPVYTTLRSGPHSTPRANGKAALLYTGVVSEDRGALIHAGLVHLRDDIEVHVVGRCSPELAARMREVAGNRRNQLQIVGEGYHVPYERIVEAYNQREWLAGLALFPSTPHYREKELTKFFEYMAAEIPVLCSNFPAWQRLIRGTDCGIAVDPRDSGELRAALDRIIGSDKEARRMGRNGQEAVANRYNWEAEGRRLLDLYSSFTDMPIRAGQT